MELFIVSVTQLTAQNEKVSESRRFRFLRLFVQQRQQVSVLTSGLKFRADILLAWQRNVFLPVLLASQTKLPTKKPFLLIERTGR